MRTLIIFLLFIAILYATTTYYTFGDSANSLTEAAYTRHYIYYFKVATTSDVVLDSIYTRTMDTHAAVLLKMAFYTDNAGNPDAFIDSSTTEITTVDSGLWHGLKFSKDTTIVAGDYWMACWQGFRATIGKPRGAGGSNNWRNQALTYGAWPVSATPGGVNAFDDIDTYIRGYVITADDKTNQFKKYPGYNKY